MTIAPNTRRAPEFGLGHRLALAREVAGIDRDEMADIVGLTTQTLSNYELGKTTPAKLTLNAWAVATGVDVEWLKTGKAQEDNTPRGGSEGHPSDYFALHLDSNLTPRFQRRAA